MNKMLNLYGLSNEVLRLRERVFDEETGEVDEMILGYLTERKDNLVEACGDVCCLIKSMYVYEDDIDREIERLKALKAQVSRRNDSLKKNVGNAMKAVGITKIERPDVVVKFTKSVGTIILDEDKIPTEFKKIETKTITSVDKMAIKKAIQNGTEVEGAMLEERDNLQVK